MVSLDVHTLHDTVLYGLQAYYSGKGSRCGTLAWIHKSETKPIWFMNSGEVSGSNGNPPEADGLCAVRTSGPWQKVGTECS